MKRIYIEYYKTKIGELILGDYDNKICLVDFRYRRMRQVVDNRIKKGLNSCFFEKKTFLLDTAKKQIDEYLLAKRTLFSLPIITVGTDFQKEVWNKLIEIPYGKTSTYLKIATFLNKPKAARAVANANGKNAIGLVIPCHRVIESSGSLGGYGGGIAVKKRLLKLEQSL